MKITQFRKLIREEIRKVLKEDGEPLDPNATYRIDVEMGRGGYDPGNMEKVSGNPLSVAKAVEQEALEYGDEEFIDIIKLDQYTYLVTNEESVTIVGSPKSKKYGKFWIDPTSDTSEDLYYEMENNL